MSKEKKVLHQKVFINDCLDDPLFKVGLSPSKKYSFYLLQMKALKKYEKFFLFHLKSSFRSQDI